MDTQTKSKKEVIREKLEKEVHTKEFLLQYAQKELRWLDEAPERCQCDPQTWGCCPGPVCPKFEPGQDFPRYCANCEHPSECHGGAK